VVGLAEPERQPDHEFFPDIADDVIGNLFRVGKDFRHQALDHNLYEAARNRANAFSYSAFAADIRLR